MRLNFWRVKTQLFFLDDTDDFNIWYCYHDDDDDSIIYRLIFHQHVLLCHAGLKTLLGVLLERFWILSRKIIEQVLSKCMICKRNSRKIFETPFAQLLRDRIASVAPFELTGVDYSLLLLFGVIYMCCEIFILSFRRFIALKERISTIYWNKSTSFVIFNIFWKYWLG